MANQANRHKQIRQKPIRQIKQIRQTSKNKENIKSQFMSFPDKVEDKDVIQSPIMLAMLRSRIKMSSRLTMRLTTRTRMRLRLRMTTKTRMSSSVQEPHSCVSDNVAGDLPDCSL